MLTYRFNHIRLGKGIMTKQPDKITALYCRLSRDDEQDGMSEASKISRPSLEKYAQENGFKNTPRIH